MNQYITVLRSALIKESDPYNNTSNNTKATLFIQEAQKCFVENFLEETLNLAVLDSGCTKTVCGKEWYNWEYDGKFY